MPVYLPKSEVDEVMVEQFRFLMLHKQEHGSGECDLCGRLDKIKILLLLPFKEHTEKPCAESSSL